MGGFFITLKKRIFYLDFVRAFAISLIVLAHVSHSFVYPHIHGGSNWYLPTFFNIFSLMGVPLFLMISGTLLLNKDIVLGDFLKKRLSRVLIPFIFWALLFPFFKLFVLQQTVSVKSGFLDILRIYWFVFMIVGVYMILPIINSFIKEYKISGLEYFLVIWLVVLVFNTLGISYPKSFSLFYHLTGYVGYVVLGYYLSVKQFKFTDSQMIKIGLILCLVFLVIDYAYTLHISPHKGDILRFHYGTIVPALQSAGFFIFIRYFDKYCNSHKDTIKNKIYSLFKDTFLFKIILALSISSYGIFLVHYFVHDTARHIFPKLFDRNILLPVMYILILFCTWLIVYVLSKIPYLKYISGAH